MGRMIFIATLMLLAHGAARADFGEYDLLSAVVGGLTVDSTTVRTVEGVFYEHGLITITLERGTVAYLQPVGKQRIGIVFKGNGSVSFQPNLVTERTNLERFTNSEVFTAEFTSATFLVTDTTLISLINEFPIGGKADSLDRIAEEQWKSIAMGGDGKELDESLAQTLLNQLKTDVLVSRFTHSDISDFYLIHDPFNNEPYRLFLAKAAGTHITRPTLVSQCPAVSGFVAMTDDGVDACDLTRTIQHTINSSIDRSLDLVCSDRIDVVARIDTLRWFELDLYPTLIVDSVRMSGYPKLNFHRAKESSELWVKLPRAFAKDEKFSVEVFYHGDVIDRIEDYPILMTSTGWYPASARKHKTFFDVRFEYPESMTLAAVGSRTLFETINARTTARWVTGREVRNYSFHVGFFKRLDFPAEGKAPRGGVLYRTPQQVDVVLNDVKQSLLFYTNLYGSLPIDSLFATELPGFHGEAFPGLLHLSSMTFYSSDDQDFFAEQFIAHEIAHQWWGIGVDFQSYRDQWLSEGFSEYSCLMYSQLASVDKKKFFKLLEQYRKEIVSFGKRTLGRDLPPPAIALGYRVNSGAPRGGAYNTFVYYKGAWILHMLRNMMLNIETMNEDVFMTVMKTYYAKYKGKRASTEDFRKTILEVTKVDFSWFFDQWVYGNKIPSYTYAWKKVKQADGKWKVTVRIKQTGVPETFQMYVPIKLELDNDKIVRYRLLMSGTEQTVELPITDVEPDELVFNDLASVLCDVDEESFD